MSVDRRRPNISLTVVEPTALGDADCVEPCCASEPVVDETCDDGCCPTPRAGPDVSTLRSGTVDGVGDVSATGERSVLRVSGMDCASCAVTIEKRVAAVDGVHRATVNFAAGRLDVDHDPDVDRAVLESAVEKAGYQVERSVAAVAAPFWRLPRVVLTVAGSALFALGAAMWAMDAPSWLVNATYAAAAAIGGFPIYRSALVSIRARVADVNLLMTLAVIGAAIIGAWGEAALVVILFSVSNALQVYAVGRTRSAVRALARLTPDEVLVRRDGGDVVVPAADVVVGDVVIVRPGERIAVDGTIAEGASALDESPVTGESTPVEKGTGDAVYSGSLNGPGGLVVEVTKAAGDSTLQRIARMVEDAQGTKAPIEQFVARFSRIYTPVVLALAVAVAVVPPLFGGDVSTWFYRALVLLIVSCPCALVISTPVSVVSGIGGASRRGILIKGGDALEATGKLSTLFFDKTGTLTEGRPVVARVLVIDGSEPGSALAIAAALERRSEHPLAHAILTAADDAPLADVGSFRSIVGRGAEGVIGGERYLVGSPRLFEEQGVDLAPAGDALRAVADAGETPVILGRTRTVVAVFGLADAIRPGARAALEELRGLGIEHLVMLTGDAEAPARRIADALDIEFRSDLLPEDKVAAIRETADRRGTTGMVGDGINDAPALAAADVSFAMGAAGTDAALEAADVALMADDLSKLAEAIRLSRKADRTIKQNIVVSIVFNTAFTILAPLGIVPLWLAVLEDAISSTGVTANSLRLLRMPAPRAKHAPDPLEPGGVLARRSPGGPHPVGDNL
jgi:Cd2+/Zn2+-exporting ATPase